MERDDVPANSILFQNRLVAVLAAVAVGVAVFAVPGAAQAEILVADDSYIANAQETFTSPAGGGVLANDSMADLNWSLTVFQTATHGRVVPVGPGGSFTYRPNDGFIGSDSFQYCVTEKPATPPCLSAPATVSMTVRSSVQRIGGADRFAVSADLSSRTYAPGAAVAYVVSGQVYPDALSASASAGARGAPVLLVMKDTIPGPIAEELRRLKPQKIVVIGGTNTISDSVQTSLGLYSADVTRISGADRFEVSARVSSDTFTGHVSVAFVASGANFPDALSGSAAAGRLHGPILLVQKDEIPEAIAAEIARLNPDKIIVLGGPNSISDAVRSTLGSLQTSPLTSRITGQDRYAVAALVSAAVWPEEKPAYTAYVASGETFPDALSGSAVAINDGAPVLLVTKHTIPDSVAAELDRLNPTRIVVLGGPNTIDEDVLEALKTYLAG